MSAPQFSEAKGAEGAGLEYFESLHHLEGRRFTSIAHAREVLGLLGNPQNQLPTIHVAGTNGKGTVCALLSAILHAAGAQVGQTVSPHLTEVNERCLVNGAPQDPKEFGAAVGHVVAVAQSAGIELGYFVLGVIASFYEFVRLGLDWAVIEVGLGGLNDATNTIERPRATAITSIGLDHTELLGESVEEIAAVKAGILRPGVPVIVGELPEAALQTVQRLASAIGAPLFAAGLEFRYEPQDETLVYSKGRFPLKRSQLALPGRYQFRNSLVAVRIALELGISADAIYAGLQRVRWPGRLEEFLVEDGRVRVLTDVCHNPDGVRALLEHLEDLLSQGSIDKLSILLSIVDRKDWRGMLELFREFAANLLQRGIKVRMTFTHSGSSVAVSPTKLAEVYGSGLVFESPEAALDDAVTSASRSTLVVIAGSVFLVGRLRPRLTERPFLAIAPA